MHPAVTQAMVLAAGKGTRLKPLTDVLPKPLCEVAGVPLIRLALRQLANAGVTRAVINLHHLGEQIPAALGTHAEGVALEYSPETTILGTGGGIRAALPLLGNAPFFVVNADALQDVDLRALAAAHVQSGALATLALREDPDAARYGAIGVDDTGRIRRMIDQFDDGGATRQLMFTGVHVLDHRAVDHLPLGEERCIIRQAYVPHLREGAHLHSHLHTGTFHDVGTPERWATAQFRVLSGRDAGVLRLCTSGLQERQPGLWVHPRAHVAADAQLLAPLVVHSDARVEGGAQVGPWAAVGAGATIAQGAHVERAALLAGASARGEVRDVVLGTSQRLAWPWPLG